MSSSCGTSLSMTDTSRSGDSKSEESNKSQLQHESRFEVDRQPTALDLECHIQTERIGKILHSLIFRTKMALSLPTLVQDVELLRSILLPHHLEDVLYIVMQYESECLESRTSVSQVRHMRSMKSSTTMSDHRLNPELAHLLFIIGSYPELQEHIEDIINKMRYDYEEDNEQVNPGLEYLMTLEQFEALMLRQMQRTAAEELKMRIKVWKVRNSNDVYLKKIKDCNNMINAEQQAFEELMRHKKETIANIEQELSWLTMETAVNLKKAVLDSDRQMVLKSRAHKVNFKILEEDEKDTYKAYKDLLSANMISEKKKRLHRFKIETQLLTWIQKYDFDMGEKQTELDDYADLKKLEIERLDIAEKKLVEIDKEHTPLMEEKEIEYHEEMGQKLKEFELEHAARVIQRCWKYALENRNKKKKMKKEMVKLKLKLEIQTKKMELLEKKRLAAEKKHQKKKK